MNLPEHLKKKMAESWMHVSMKSSQISANSYLVDKEIHDMSYLNACVELLPMIEKMEKALDRTIFDMNQSMLLDKAPISMMIKEAHDAIVELNKWRES